jgi:hypothetical protein
VVTTTQAPAQAQSCNASILSPYVNLDKSMLDPTFRDRQIAFSVNYTFASTKAGTPA